VPQSPLDPVEPEITDDCLGDCDDDCEDCEDCEGHPLKAARDGLDRVSRIISDSQVRGAASNINDDIPSEISETMRKLFSFLQNKKLVELMDALTDADRRVADDRAMEDRAARANAMSAARVRGATEMDATGTAGREDEAPDVPIRSEPEVSALDRVRALVARQQKKGALATQVKGIQDSPEIRRFVVEALRSTEKDQ
jgi:hypothetical protein